MPIFEDKYEYFTGQGVDPISDTSIIHRAPTDITPPTSAHIWRIHKEDGWERLYGGTSGLTDHAGLVQLLDVLYASGDLQEIEISKG